MDLQSTARLAGKRWGLIKGAALLFFAIAGVLMIVSLVNAGRARAGSASPTPVAALGMS